MLDLARFGTENYKKRAKGQFRVIVSTNMLAEIDPVKIAE
jgi:hypothetical protein